MNKKRLGKGLSALIPDMSTNDNASAPLLGRKLVEIPLEKIRTNPVQPRKEFNQEKLVEMAGTIQRYGVIQPILVVEDDDHYTIIAGERRFRAAQIAGLETIPAEIRDFSAEEHTEIALIENLQREDLNPIEEALAYHRLIEEFNLTQDEVAKKLGRSRSSVANIIRLLSLPDDIKNEIISGKLTPGQVRPILSLPDEDEQRKIAAKIIKENLTARQVEKYVQNIKNKSQAKNETKKSVVEENLQTEIIKEMEDKLRQNFGTKVFITNRKKEGKIEFYFYSNEDLDRLLQLLLKE
ncbi:MAG: ParB/RepB/Spo0J family partition protein [Firmicutes bacterium]|nr:ParB/RepB/Spo0J family partition protein [Bacillota bacterium]